MPLKRGIFCKFKRTKNMVSLLSCQNLVISILEEHDFLIAHKTINSCAHCVKISYL